MPVPVEPCSGPAEPGSGPSLQPPELWPEPASSEVPMLPPPGQLDATATPSLQQLRWDVEKLGEQVLAHFRRQEALLLECLRARPQQNSPLIRPAASPSQEFELAEAQEGMHFADSVDSIENADDTSNHEGERCGKDVPELVTQPKRGRHSMMEFLKRQAAEVKSKDRRTIIQERLTEAQAFRRRLGVSLESNTCYTLMLLVILSNVISVGLEVNAEATQPLSEVSPAYGIINIVYTCIYSLEVSLRVAALGPATFFGGEAMYWNMFDSGIVFFAIVEHICAALLLSGSEEFSMGHLRIFRILRIAKMIRGVRLMKLLRFVSSLRTLLLSITNTLKSLIWTALLILLILYGTGVVLTQASSDHCREEVHRITGQLDGKPYCSNPRIRKYWTSLPDSMFTLYKAIANGVSWQDAQEPLSELGAVWLMVFIAYTCFMIFAILNVVTGVFCQTAIESAAADKELATMMQMEHRKDYVETLRKLFHEIDEDESNLITLNEFESKLSDEEMSAFFMSIELDVADAWILFSLIDIDGSGCIDLDEFVSGCLQLRGSAKALHMAQLQVEQRSMRRSITTIEQSIVKLADAVQRSVVGVGPLLRQISQRSSK